MWKMGPELPQMGVWHLGAGLGTPAAGDGEKGLYPQGMGQPSALVGPKLCHEQSAWGESNISPIAWCELLWQ